MTLDDIKEEVKKAQTIVILTHEYPDGDAVRKFSCDVSCLNWNGERGRYSYT